MDGKHTSVVELRLLVKVDAVHLAGDGLEHGSTAGTGRAEDHEHLARVEDAIDRVENLDLALAVAKQVTKLTEEVEWNIADRLLVIWVLSACDVMCEVMVGGANGGRDEWGSGEIISDSRATTSAD